MDVEKVMIVFIAGTVLTALSALGGFLCLMDIRSILEEISARAIIANDWLCECHEKLCCIDQGQSYEKSMLMLMVKRLEVLNKTKTDTDIIKKDVEKIRKHTEKIEKNSAIK